MGGPQIQYTSYSHIFGRESYPSNVMGLVKVVSHENIPKPIATPVPVSLLTPRMHIARPREYLAPEDVDHLDARLSHEEYGSELYRRAKAILFDLEAVKPGKSRKLELKDGSVAEVHDYRPWLSHWLIHGLADLSEYDEKLKDAGIVPCNDLEAKLVYNDGIDFSGVQYKVMTDMLKELVENVHAEQGTPKREDATLHDYLTGKITTPLLGDWKLLEVFGNISEEIQKAAASKNREQFENHEGFYWAVRMWNVWRSAYCKQHAISYDGQNIGKHNPDRWDYIPVAEGYRQLTEGALERIDDVFDWVAIGGITQVNRQDGYNLGQTENKRMFIYRLGSNEPAPEVIVKIPRELWIDYVALTDVLRSLMGRYLKKKGETIIANSANYILDPASTTIDEFYSHHSDIISPFTKYDSSSGASKSKEIGKGSLEKCLHQIKLLTDAIKDGTFEQEFDIPAGTIGHMLWVMRSLGSHIPKELCEYISRQEQIIELNSIVNEERTNVNKAAKNYVKLSSMSIDARNNKGIKRIGNKLEETNRKYARRYKETYGANPLELDSSILEDTNKFYLGVLSTYGLDSLQRYISLVSSGMDSIIKKPLEEVPYLTSPSGVIKLVIR